MDLVFVFFGANDNVDSELKRQEMAVQHVSLKDYRSNLMDIIKYLKNVCKVSWSGLELGLGLGLQIVLYCFAYELFSKYIYIFRLDV